MSDEWWNGVLWGAAGAAFVYVLILVLGIAGGLMP